MDLMQLFQPIHYNAFEKPKPNLDDRPTRRERLNVRDRFLELDNILWSYINNTSWDLHRHRQPAHYVSSDHFIYLADGTPIVNKIDGMWLHYGKSPEQLDFMKTIGGYDYSKLDTENYYNAFYLHTRIQFFINREVFRCWLLLATDKNYYDRSEYLRKLAKDQAARDQLFSLVSRLKGKGFFYEIDWESLPIDNNLTQEKFIRFVKQDRGDVYSGIVKEYQPNDILLRKYRIGAEMIENLELLYPIYNFMAYRPVI